MRRLSYILILVVVLITGCTGASPGMVTPDASEDPACAGDFYDPPGGWSTWNSTWQTINVRRSTDPPSEYSWYPDTFEPHKIVHEETFLESSNGNQIHVNIHRPEWACPERPCHALVLVPGGSQSGEVWHVPWRRAGAKHWAATGFIVADIDFQGRGYSGGEEDYGGPVHREDLKTVIEFLAAQPSVLNNEVGVVSSSFGATVTASTLGTYPDLPVRFWVDLEGASDRYEATQNNDWLWVNIWGGHTTSDDEFWSTREAITYQPCIKAPYIRVQSVEDHAFDYFYVDHAFNMVNEALTGNCSYARMNNNEPNVLLNTDTSNEYQFETLDYLDEAMYIYVVEASLLEY